MCFAGRVYTEVALSPSFMTWIALIDVAIGEVGPCDDFHRRVWQCKY